MASDAKVKEQQQIELAVEMANDALNKKLELPQIRDDCLGNRMIAVATLAVKIYDVLRAHGIRD